MALFLVRYGLNKIESVFLFLHGLQLVGDSEENTVEYWRRILAGITSVFVSMSMEYCNMQGNIVSYLRNTK